MSHELSLKEIKKEWHGTLSAYLIGLVASLLFTTLSFFLVIERPLSEPYLVYSIVSLALIQAIFQLRFFLHLGQEAKPRWESIVFYFMVMVLLIVALGSLWIMYDLDQRVMRMEMSHD
jgi:cytochrome o ubiquinol oxidase subunit IV